MQEAMRKSFSILMLFAAAAIASVSCQKQDAATSELEQTTLVFTSEKPDFDDAVKTEWVEAENDVWWSHGDKIRMAYTITVSGTPIWQGAEGANNKDGNPEEARLYVSNALDFDGGTSRIGTFKIPGSFNEDPANPMLEVGKYNFYTLFPSTCNESGKFVSERPGVVYITLEPEQTPKANTFDSKADIMVGRSVKEYDGLPTEAISVNWNRAVAHAYITLENLKESVAGEVVNNITLTAQADANIAGTFTIDITDGTIEPRNDSNPKNVLVINAANLPAITSSQDVSFWACLNPCTLTSLTVEVDTDKATYVRSIDLSANNKTFLKNRRNLLSINMGGGDVVRTPKVITDTYTAIKSVNDMSSGVYFIGGNNQNTFAQSTTMSLWTGEIVSNTQLKTTTATFNINSFNGDLSTVASVKVESTSAENEFYLKVGDKYLSASGTTLSLSDSAFSWTIENLTGEKEGMVLSSSQCVLSVNANSNSIRAYSSKKYKGIYFFKKN